MSPTVCYREAVKYGFRDQSLGPSDLKQYLGVRTVLSLNYKRVSALGASHLYNMTYI